MPNLTCLGQIPLVASPLPTHTAVSATYQVPVMVQTQSLALLESMQSNWAVLSCLLIEKLLTWLGVRQKTMGIHSSVGLLQHLVEIKAQHTHTEWQVEWISRYRLLTVSNQEMKEKYRVIWWSPHATRHSMTVNGFRSSCHQWGYFVVHS